MIAYYLSHPQVAIDPAVPVPDWGLTDAGAVRIAALAARWPRMRAQVVSSAERKALETAWPLGRALATPVEVRTACHENDRSATGYLKPAEFEATTDTFFAHPDQSVRGWEPAAQAQARIVDQVRQVIAAHRDRTLIFTGHGGVGTLLYCALAGQDIDRKWDQTGPGNWFSFDPGALRACTHWALLETLFAD